MVLAKTKVAHDNEAQIILADSGLAERHIFGDGVVLTIAAAASQRFERSAPAIDDTPLRQIGHRLDGEVDRAIDGADASTPFTSLALGNNGQKFLRRCRAG